MPAAKSPPPAPLPPPPRRTAAEIVAGQPSGVTQPPINVKHVASALQGLWLILQGVVWLVAGKTHTLDSLTEKEAQDDATIVWPLVEKYPTIGRILSWIGAPIVLVRRVSEKLRRKHDGDAKNGRGDPGPAQGRA